MTEALICCRFCGGEPIFHRTMVICNQCNHEITDYTIANSLIFYSPEFSRPRLITYWNRRNEKNNPFIKEEK